MVDKSLILRKLAELEECLDQIKEYSNKEYSGTENEKRYKKIRYIGKKSCGI
ncbi:MAG: hypothetical protein JRJ57_02440 [Deltaproteobacteria bacterium]|nr:hypothetical protein [Deltaproteobacteria bacterium]MBW2104484.1 hypothetical protein [Deltaproteobacteria bacterium]